MATFGSSIHDNGEPEGDNGLTGLDDQRGTEPQFQPTGIRNAYFVLESTKVGLLNCHINVGLLNCHINVVLCNGTLYLPAPPTQCSSLSLPITMLAPPIAMLATPITILATPLSC